ncbi:hypothetical protein OG422_14910 [Streptomyces sp. NBC_01525]
MTAVGARLLDVVIPAIGSPAGVALNAGSELGMLFPPPRPTRRPHPTPPTLSA